MASSTHAAAIGTLHAAPGTQSVETIVNYVDELLEGEVGEPVASVVDWAKAFELSDGSLAAVLHLGTVETTQSLASAYTVISGGVNSALAVVADSQTAGKGRGSNKWESPPPGAGLLTTMVLECPTNDGMSHIPLAQHAASLAVVRAVTDELEAAGLKTSNSSAKELRIKWPNDLYILDRSSDAADAPATSPPPDAELPSHRSLEAFHGGARLRKAGGILCNLHIDSTSSGSKRVFTCVGLGLNLHGAPAGRGCVAELLRAQPGDAASASARAASSAATDAIDEGLRARLLGRVHGHLNKLWAETLQARGCEPWRKEYEAAWLHSGQSVEVSGGRPAIVQGLAATGELMAVSAGDEAGTAFDLGPGDSDVDLMDGLVRRATST